jgi:hypothetical protein
MDVSQLCVWATARKALTSASFAKAGPAVGFSGDAE